MNSRQTRLREIGTMIEARGRPLRDMISSRTIHDPFDASRDGVVALAMGTDVVDRRHADIQRGLDDGRRVSGSRPDDPTAVLQRDCLQTLCETDDEHVRLAMFVESALHVVLDSARQVDRDPAVDEARRLRDEARSVIADAGVEWPTGDRGPSSLPTRLVGRMGDLRHGDPARVSASVARAICEGMRGMTICSFRYHHEKPPKEVDTRTQPHPILMGRMRPEPDMVASGSADGVRSAKDLVGIPTTDLRTIIDQMGVRGSGEVYGISENEMRKICTSKGFIPNRRQV